MDAIKLFFQSIAVSAEGRGSIRTQRTFPRSAPE